MDPETDENINTRGSEDEGEMPLFGDSHPPKKKHRGASQGPPPVPVGQKRFIKTNEYGQPNEIDADTRALVGDIGLQVRETLPIGFEEFEDVPLDRVQMVLDTLEKKYVLRHVSKVFLHGKMNKAWRDRRYYLRRKYIKEKSMAEVKAAKTPVFVRTEDWNVFIDISNTDEFKALSERNTANRAQLELPNSSGRHSMAQIRHKIAIEKNVSDAEVGRAEAYIAMQSKKNKPDHAKIVKMKAIMREKPETRLTGPNDAMAQSWGKETRGRMRAMGEGVSPSSMKFSAHMVNKLVDSERRNAENESLVHRLDIELKEFKEFVTKEFAKTKTRMEKDYCSPEITPSSSSSSLHACQDKGKKCELFAWGQNIVARGEVVEVDPKAIVHNVEIGEGNYKILVEGVVEQDALLFRRNSQVETLFDVLGGYTVWPKQFLKFCN